MTGGFVRNNVNQFAFLYRLIDILVIQVSWYLIASLYGISYSADYFMLALIATVAFSFMAEMLWLYRSWRAGSLWEMFFYTLLSWTVTLFPILVFLFFTKQSEEISRLALGTWMVSTAILLCSWRLTLRFILYHQRLRGRNTRTVAIVGLAGPGCMLAQELLNHPETGYRVVGLFDDRIPERLDEKFRDLVKGKVEDAVQMARNGEIDVLFLGLPFSAKNRIESIMRRLGDTTVDLHLIPDFFIYNLLHARIGSVGDIQTVSVYDTPIRGGWSVIKRLEDLLLASLILCIIAIPMLLIAIGIKITSPGPVLFRQDRYGLDGRKIKVLKFRSMRCAENGSKVVQATRNDSRITPFGAFLRRTSLDELPQFFNVLGGTMSVVGPRPHAVAHNEEFRKTVEYYMLRHKMKPGITGWAQVNGYRGETDTLEKMQKRIEYDLEYIRNWSLWLDLKIITATMHKGFTHSNAY